MAEIALFGNMHYNQSKLKDIENVVSVSSELMNQVYLEEYRKYPYNCANVIIPEGAENLKYRNSTNKFFGWLLRDVMIIDKNQSLYIYKLTFHLEGAEYTRYFFVGLLKIEDYSDKIKSFQENNENLVNERYLLLKECQANLEPITIGYSDSGLEINNLIKDYAINKEPIINFIDKEENRHELFRIEDESIIEKIKNKLAEENLIILEGNNIYEAALKYKNEMKEKLGNSFTGKEPFNYVLSNFCSLEDKTYKFMYFNILLGDINFTPSELLKKLDSCFKISALGFESNKERLARIKMRSLLIENNNKRKKSFGLYIKNVTNKYFILSLKDDVKFNVIPALKDYDSVIVKELIIKQLLNINLDSYSNINYINNDLYVFEMVKAGKYDLGIFTNKLEIEDILNLLKNNLLLPSRSVCIYPVSYCGLTGFSFKYTKIK